ncbi:MAG: hypothetical protein FWF86_03915 [Clostridia bacterium]|nr:hypothetical protein [Clostridia bacterium]
MDQRRLRKWLAAALCLLFLAGVMLAVMLMLVHSQCHCGYEPDCLVCVQITEALALSKRSGLAAVIVIFASLMFIRAHMLHITLDRGWANTPVTLKTRMNN